MKSLQNATMTLALLMLVSMFLCRMVVNAMCSEMSKSVVNGYAVSNLDNNGWTRCYYVTYATTTRMVNITSHCPSGVDHYLFIGALNISSSDQFFVGAFASYQVITRITNSSSIAYKPSIYKNDNSYTIYWYNVPGKAFGFAPSSSIFLNQADTVGWG
eukprot:244926_1